MCGVDDGADACLDPSVDWEDVMEGFSAVLCLLEDELADSFFVLDCLAGVED